jgi:hypothetical protein
MICFCCDNKKRSTYKLLQKLPDEEIKDLCIFYYIDCDEDSKKKLANLNYFDYKDFLSYMLDSLNTKELSCICTALNIKYTTENKTIERISKMQITWTEIKKLKNKVNRE